MEKIFCFSALVLLSIFSLINSQKSCEEIIQAKIDEDTMIKEIETNMLEIKKESDK
jgi:hypothetical protein